MNVKYLKFNSFSQKELVLLREKVLRIPLGMKFSLEELALEKNQHHFGIFDNEKLVGGLILVNQENNIAKMRQVCIDFEYQNKGIGQELVIFSENWAKQQGFTKIYCHARENALNFYKKLNYIKEGKMFLEVGLEHYKLIKMF